VKPWPRHVWYFEHWGKGKGELEWYVMSVKCQVNM